MLIEQIEPIERIVEGGRPIKVPKQKTKKQ